MSLVKRKVILLFRLPSTAFLGFLLIIYFQICNSDYINKSQLIHNLKKKLDKKFLCLNIFKNEIFWNIDEYTKCNIIKYGYRIFYNISENNYLYYSLAILLGAVVNINIMIKIGIFC